MNIKKMTTVRRAAMDDLDSLSLLFDSYRVFYKKESNVSAGEFFLSERMLNNESEIFVSLNEEGTMTGFVQLYPLFSSTRLKPLWLLNDLYVHPSHRGQGISKLLIDKAKDLCRETKSCGLILETAMTNEIGNRLYPTTGFTLDNEHNYYYWDTDS